jgi:ProP effector
MQVFEHSRRVFENVFTAADEKSAARCLLKTELRHPAWRSAGSAHIAFRSSCYNPRIFLVVDCIMGFEQLAALKEQLAKQAEEKRAARHAKHARPARPAKPAEAAKQAAVAKHANGGRNTPDAARTAPEQKAAAHKSSAPKQSAQKSPAQKSKPVDPVVLSIGKLQKRFPKAFPKNPAPKVPLKVGIFKDLLEHSEELGLNEAALRDAIKVWCWGSRYWACVTENAMRVDLNGQDAGQVLPAEAARARGLQAKRQKARNAAQGATAPQGAAAAQKGAVQQESGAPEQGAVQQDGSASEQGAAPQDSVASQQDATPQEAAVQQASNAEQNVSAQPDHPAAQEDSAAPQGSAVE